MVDLQRANDRSISYRNARVCTLFIVVVFVIITQAIFLILCRVGCVNNANCKNHGHKLIRNSGSGCTHDLPSVIYL